MNIQKASSAGPQMIIFLTRIYAARPHPDMCEKLGANANASRERVMPLEHYALTSLGRIWLGACGQPGCEAAPAGSSVGECSPLLLAKERCRLPLMQVHDGTSLHISSRPRREKPKAILAVALLRRGSAMASRFAKERSRLRSLTPFGFEAVSQAAVGGRAVQANSRLNKKALAVMLRNLLHSM
jgi:hypothetical protein